jgi:hypothetical protein
LAERIGGGIPQQQAFTSMASIAVGALHKRYLQAMQEAEQERRKDVEFRLNSHCRLTKTIRTSGKQRTRIIFFESGQAYPVGSKGLLVDVLGVDVLTPSEAAQRFPKDVALCGAEKWKQYERAKTICCIRLGPDRVEVEDVVLLRPLNVWLQRQVSLSQRTLMFCKRADVGKTIKLPHTRGQTIVKLDVTGFSKARMPAFSK